MNDAQAIQAVLDDLSAPKLTAYKNLGLKDDWQVIQSYIFLLDLAGHFVVPLQLLEIALRNKMYKEIAKQTKNQFWYNAVPYSKDSKRQVTLAKSEALKDGKTSPDDIICRLMFGFWVYMTDKPYRPSFTPKAGEPAGTNLWQFIKGDVFPGATASMNHIFDELKAINKMRNRLFHHEPLWKLSGHQDLAAAVARTRAQYDRVLKVLGWISPEKLNLINGLGNTAKFYTACDATLFKPMPTAAEQAAKDAKDAQDAQDAQDGSTLVEQANGTQAPQSQTVTTKAA
ncbi:hypothetical protein ACFOHT_00150 [Massilia oculi]|uniref:hypothetical protein n=1 Tax=Massilia oculi TaxID=945844 RepID=UPI003609A7B3